MSSAPIHITPKQILSYLCDFENKLPKPKNNIYITTLLSNSISKEDLSKEARNMMEYVGLVGYKPICRWKPHDGTGGEILLNKNTDKIVEIHVSEKYRTNIKAVCAVLSHEICHKLLYENNIYWPDFPEQTEISTDLCTIYMGLGKLVIEGYVDANSKDNQILGYLELPIYKRTYNLLQTILWNKYINVQEDNSEPYLQDAYELWKSRENKKALLIDSYKKAFEKYAQISRYSEISHQIQRQFLEYIYDNYLKEEDQFFDENWFDNDITIRPIKAFSGLYKILILQEQMNTERHIEEIIHYQNYLLYILQCALPKNIIARLASESIFCPHCKSQFSGLKLVGRKLIIKCPKCKRRLFVNGEIHDLSESQNDYFSFRNSILTEAKELLKTDNTKQIQKAFKDGEHSMEKKTLNVIKQFSCERKEAIKKQAKAEKELQELKNKINKLPEWLKIIIGKRLD